KGVAESEAGGVVAKLHARPKRQNQWWAALHATPALEAFCRANPGVVVYAELYGATNCIKYGFPDGSRLAAFDVMRDGRFLDAQAGRRMLRAAGVPVVPLLGVVRYDFDAVCAMADGPTLAEGATAGTMREGCVVKPLRERRDDRVGRVALKCVSAA